MVRYSGREIFSGYLLIVLLLYYTFTVRCVYIIHEVCNVCTGFMDIHVYCVHCVFVCLCVCSYHMLKVQGVGSTSSAATRE